MQELYIYFHDQRAYLESVHVVIYPYKYSTDMLIVKSICIYLSIRTYSCKISYIECNFQGD